MTNWQKNTLKTVLQMVVTVIGAFLGSNLI